MVYGQGDGDTAEWGRGYLRGAAVEAGILESKDMDRALITGSAQEGGIMAEVDAGRQTNSEAHMLYGVGLPAYHT